eukprot:CAMPEP_0206444220 /NCGR_PEP_ID=MMETSP0324_2-20121206/14794_1 /ASSEMBLY_ACC=CAM_ASM_000836 /TAXON_ID=2866 /ORGANISM="Crypthecodinium cohnii, Strain Seligo" /LENGTH=67 /DNA_ID=CAMNT_0053912225 /DNA_START=53 /DNA_END=253 /DNA_ORIENTATION=+
MRPMARKGQTTVAAMENMARSLRGLVGTVVMGYSAFAMVRRLSPKATAKPQRNKIACIISSAVGEGW